MSVNRREFLVSVGGMAMGRAVLDWQPSNPKLDKKGELPTIRLAVAPSKAPYVHGGYLLVWTELTENGPETMMWHPETPQELADAQAFYEAALNHEGVPGVEQPPQTAAGKVAKWLRDLVEPDPRKRSKTETELLRAIAADPDNDSPLLRYAAWLEKKGSPQGEFIRVDRELEPMAQDDPRRPPLDTRWTELYEEYGEKFVSPLQKVGAMPVVAGAICPALSLRRGVIGHVDIEKPGIVPEKMEYLFAVAPLIDELVLSFENVDVKTIVSQPQMAQVRSLEISGHSAGFDADAVKAIVQSPYTDALRKLNLSFNEIGPEGAHWLSTARFLAQLEELALIGARIGRQGLRSLLARQAFDRLRTLDLWQNDLDGEAVAELARCPSLRSLEHLKLKENRNAWDGLAALAESTFAGRLLSLTISYMNPVASELAAFARGRYERLESLDASSSRMDEVGLAPFVEAGWFAGLKELELGFNDLTREAGSLLESVPFRRLEKLDLGSNSLEDAGVTALARSPHLTSLRDLDLATVSVGVAGVRELTNSPRFPQLERLRIDGNDIGYDGAVALAKTRRFNLTDLWVDEESVGKEGRTLLEKRYGDAVTFS